MTIIKWSEHFFFFLQACQLKSDTITYEEKEQQLVSDCVKELRKCDTDFDARKDCSTTFPYLFVLQFA